MRVGSETFSSAGCCARTSGSWCDAQRGRRRAEERLGRHDGSHWQRTSARTPDNRWGSRNQSAPKPPKMSGQKWPILKSFWPDSFQVRPPSGAFVRTAVPAASRPIFVRTSRSGSSIGPIRAVRRVLSLHRPIAGTRKLLRSAYNLEKKYNSTQHLHIEVWPQ